MKSYGLIEWKKNKPARVFIFTETNLCKCVGIGSIMENFAIFIGIKKYTLTEKAEEFAIEHNLQEINVDTNENCCMESNYLLYGRG